MQELTKDPRSDSRTNTRTPQPRLLSPYAPPPPLLFLCVPPCTSVPSVVRLLIEFTPHRSYHIPIHDHPFILSGEKRHLRREVDP